MDEGQPVTGLLQIRESDTETSLVEDVLFDLLIMRQLSPASRFPLSGGVVDLDPASWLARVCTQVERAGKCTSRSGRPLDTGRSFMDELGSCL